MNQKNKYSRILFSFLNCERGSSRQTLFFAFGLLFILSAVYFYGFERSLFYSQLNEMLFIYSGEYLHKFLAKPGGTLEYVGIFVTQGYYSNIIGTFIISSLPLILAMILSKIWRILSINKTFLLIATILPPFLLFLLQIHYEYFLHQSLGFLFVLFGFCVSIASNDKYRRLLFIILFTLFYYLIGSFAAIYLGLCITYSLTYEKGIFRFLIPTFLILNALLTFIVFRNILFFQTPAELLEYPIISEDFDEFSIKFYLLSACLIFIPLIAKGSEIPQLNWNQKLFDLITLLILFTATIIFFVVHYNRENTNLMQIKKLAFEQDWPEVLRLNENSPAKSMEGQFFYNLALSEEGQLCDRLFFRPQDFGVESLFLPRSREYVNEKSLFYYCVGLTGEALHLAYESLVINGYQPENIKLIIKLELIHGNFMVAERYINFLKNTMLYRRWAIKYGKMLFNPEMILADNELGEKIKYLTKNDFFLSSDDVRNIDLALIINPLNKKAFEYKIVFLLLKKDFKSVVYQVKKMKDMGYKTIPRHIEEAIVLFMNNNFELPYLGELFVKPETLERFKEFEKLTSKKNNTIIVENTFWYYVKD